MPLFSKNLSLYEKQDDKNKGNNYPLLIKSSLQTIGNSARKPRIVRRDLPLCLELKTASAQEGKEGVPQ